MISEPTNNQKYWLFTFNNDKAKERNESVGFDWQNPVIYIEAGFRTVITGNFGGIIDADIGDYCFIYQCNSSNHRKRGIYGIGKIIDILHSQEDIKSRYAVIYLEYYSSRDKPILSLYTEEFYDILHGRICSARSKYGYTTLSHESAQKILDYINNKK